MLFSALPLLFAFVGTVGVASKPQIVQLPVSRTEIDIAPLIEMRGKSGPQIVEALTKQGVHVIPTRFTRPGGVEVDVAVGRQTYDWNFIETDPKTRAYYESSPRYAPVTVSDRGVSVRGAVFLAPYAGTTWETTKDRPLRDKPVILVNALAGPDSLLHEYVHFLIWRARNQAPVDVNQVKVHRPDYVAAEIYHRKRRVESQPAWGELGKLSEQEWLTILALEAHAVIDSAEEIDVTYVTAILEPELKLHQSPSYRSEQLAYRVRQCDRLRNLLEENLARINNLKRTEVYAADETFQARIKTLEDFFLRVGSRVEQARRESIQGLE